MRLTSKEKRILELSGKGLTQVEIAKKLQISQPAVSAFVRNAHRKIEEAQGIAAFAKKLGFRHEDRP